MATTTRSPASSTRRTVAGVRRGVAVLAWLAVGAVVSLGLACAGALATDSNVWFSGVRPATGTYAWPRPVPAGWPPTATSVEHDWSWLCRVRTHAASSDVRAADDSVTQINTYELLEYRFGMPMGCLSCWTTSEHHDSLAANGTDTGTFTLHERNWIARAVYNQWGERGLPETVVWPGLAVNTLVFAALAWGLRQTPGLLRRHLRGKDGLCPACGYDLRGMPASPAGSTVCSECGQTAAPRVPVSEA